MAYRRAVDISKENVNSRLTVKSNTVQPHEVVKRAALGELGNNLQAVQQKQDKLKQNGLMGPPKNIPKKVQSAVPPKKDITTKVQSAVPPKKDITKKVQSAVPPKKDITKSSTTSTNVSYVKTVLQRQESILKNITENMTNNNSENTNTLAKDTKKVTAISGFSDRKLPILNPDENVKNQPQMVPEYLIDIFQHLRDMESKLAIKENFLENHESTPKMRGILVNWLVEVHVSFKLNLDTLHLCIGIIDRYLQENKKVGKNTLQLVGTSALLIACKYEEMYVPDLEDLEYICDNTFSRRKILQMEREILKSLDFSLGRPSSIQFLRRYTKIAEATAEHHNLGKYIIELALLENEFSHVRPSLQAAAACCLSMGILNDTMDLQKLWTPTLAHFTSYTYYDIRPVIAELALLIAKSDKSKHQAIRKKYADPKYVKISVNPILNGNLIKKLTFGKK